MALTVGQIMAEISAAEDIREDIEDIWEGKQKLEDLELNTIYKLLAHYQERLKNLEIKQ